MDITVSRLNERMALRVPPELPLGLVFIVGQVEAIQPYPPNSEVIALQLTEGEHSIPCRLPQQVAEEMQLAGNERVRAGGHLLFDTREARYYLLARDIEVLPSPVQASLVQEEEETAPPQPAATAAREPGDGDRLATAELPPWVRQLAPPELQSELGLVTPEDETDAEVEADYDEIPLPAALIDYLSQAIDSDQEIELTPSLVHELLERYQVVPPDHRDTEHEPYVADAAVTESAVIVAEAQPLTDDDSVPESALAVATAATVEGEDTLATGDQKGKESSPQRQVLLLIAGVFALFVFILLVFVVIALAAGYTPFMIP